MGTVNRCCLIRLKASWYSLPDLACLIPRGRFQFDMAASHLRMHGKSQDYRIAYSAIQKVFLLPKADDVHVLLVVALDPPIRQGQTRYPFLLLQFDKDEMIEVDLQNISGIVVQGRS